MAITPGNQSSLPASRQFSVLKTEVARFVKAPNSTEILAVAGDGINDAVRRLNSRVWSFNLTSEEITLVDDQREYTIDQTLKLPRHAEFLDSDGIAARRIPYMPTKEFLIQFNDRSGSAEPKVYTILNPSNYGQMTFDVAPSPSIVAAYPKIRHWFYRYIQTLSNATDTLDVPNDAERVILWGAKQYVAELYGNSDHVGIALRNYKEAWEEMKKQHRRDDTDWSMATYYTRF